MSKSEIKALTCAISEMDIDLYCTITPYEERSIEDLILFLIETYGIFKD